MLCGQTFAATQDFIPTIKALLTELLRHGAQRLLGQAIEAEVTDWLESHRHIVDEKGHRQVVGNGRLPARAIITGVGAVEVILASAACMIDASSVKTAF